MATAKQDRQNPETLLSPTAGEFVLLLLDELYDLVVWVFSFSLTRIIARITGRHWDPEGSRLPEWKAAEETPFKIVANEYIRVEGDQFAIYDGVVYNNARVVGGADEEVQLTVAELATLQQYDPPLRNLTLARKIKRLLGEGKSDYEIALLAPCSESYAKHHRLALEKAGKPDDA